jgi:hypothetical protein
VSFSRIYSYLLPVRNALLSAKDDALLERVYPSAEAVKERLNILKYYRLSVFRDGAR